MISHTHTHHIHMMQPHHPQTPSRDRFIANRSAIDLDVARYALEGKSSTENSNDDDDENGGRMDDAGKHQHHQSIGIASPSKEAYKKSLASNYSVQNGGENGDHLNSKILAFKSKAPAPPSGMENASREMYSSNHIGVLKGGKKNSSVTSRKRGEDFWTFKSWWMIII